MNLLLSIQGQGNKHRQISHEVMNFLTSLSNAAEKSPMTALRWRVSVSDAIRVWSVGQLVSWSPASTAVRHRNRHGVPQILYRRMPAPAIFFLGKYIECCCILTLLVENSVSATSPCYCYITTTVYLVP